MTSLVERLVGLSLKQQAVFFSQLATLIDAGVGIAKSLGTVASQGSPILRRAVERMVSRLDEGVPFSDMLAAFPHLFSDFQVQMIRAGERGGTLDRRMKDMALHLEKAYAFQQKLVSQFIYPIIILHAAVFIPQIPTLVTGSIAGYLQSTLGALLPMYGAALGALIFFRLAGQSSAPRLAVDSLLLKLPFLGKIVATFSLMRFFRALCELYEAGLPISAAVEAASGACGNSLAARRLRKCLPALDSGMGFTDALRTTKMVPMMALQMMGAAETAGSLGTVLGKTADYLELEGEEALKRLAAVLPVLIYVLMGAYVGYVAIRFYIGYSNSIFSIVP